MGEMRGTRPITRMADCRIVIFGEEASLIMFSDD